MKIRNFIFLLFLSLSFTSSAQIIISGKIVDSLSGQNLSYANIYLKNKMLGTATNAEGKFFLQISEADTLIISMIGYQAKTILAHQSNYNIVIELAKKTAELDVIKVKAKKEKRRKDDPAEKIMKQVVKHKDQNNYKKLSAYQCNIYTKMQFNLNNIDTNFANNPVLRPIGFLFKNIDSTTFKKASVPLFISETSSDYYFRNEPKLENEIVKRSNTAGIQNKSVAEFSTNFYLDYNIYDDYIFIFNQNFVGPLASGGTLSYDYVMVDTTRTDSNTVYHLFYIPLRAQELTFRGHLWIDSATFAITKATLNMSKDANINFIQSMEMEKTFHFTSNHWLPYKESILVDANLSNKQLGIYALKQSFSNQYLLHQPKEKEFFNRLQKVLVSDSALVKHEDWNKLRKVPLTLQEQLSHDNIDSAMQTPYFKRMKKLFIMLNTGFLPLGKLEWGPYYTSFSWNNIEGNRYKICGRTNVKFSKKWRITAYSAYGSQDKKIKYNIHTQYFFNMSPRFYAGIDIGNDLQVMSRSAESFLNDNILASLARRTAIKYLMVEKYSLYVEKEWAKGTNNRISLFRNNIQTVAPLYFLKPDKSYLSNIRYTSILVSGRIAYKEKILEENFRRISLGTTYPIINYSYELGLQGILGGEYTFHKARIKVSDNWYVGNIGYLQLVAEAAKIWGKVPYPLLYSHVGNNSYYFDAEAFNLMNIFEFVSDQYIQAMATQHFNGFFFNKIPIFRKLQWRELVFVKAVAGTLSSEHEKITLLPTGMSALQQPYVETGFGVENIFKVLRIDALWRLTNLNNPNTQRFGVMSTIQVKF